MTNTANSSFRVYAESVRNCEKELACTLQVLRHQCSVNIAIPLLYNGWRTIQRALCLLSGRHCCPDNGELESDFLAQFCRLEKADFNALTHLHATCIETSDQRVPMSLIRRHLNAMSKVISALKRFEYAIARKPPGFFRWFSGYRIWVTLMILLGLMIFSGLVVSQVPDDGCGLTGSYYREENFSRRRVTRLDKNIDFSWGKSAPVKRLKKDHFSVRWQGILTIKAGEKKRFAAAADDSIWLYINDDLVIENKGPQKFREIKSDRIFGPGEYRIRVDYQENVGNARARLSWNTENGYWSPVPMERFRPKI